MDHCTIEEQTIIFYLCCDIDRDTTGIVEYDTFWDTYDFSTIPLASLIQIARNIITINQSRRKLYETLPRAEENGILWETFACISSKMIKIFDDIIRDFHNHTEETLQRWLQEKLGPQTTSYGDRLKQQLVRFQNRKDASDFSLEIELLH